MRHLLKYQKDRLYSFQHWKEHCMEYESAWTVARGTKSLRKCGSPDFAKPYDCTVFSHWLALFVTEVRKADGGKYPPNSVYQILCGILRFTRKQDPFVPNFLDQKDGRFHELHGTCESVFRELRQMALEQIPKKLRIYPNSKKIIFGRQEYWAVHPQKYKRTGEKKHQARSMTHHGSSAHILPTHLTQVSPLCKIMNKVESTCLMT